MKANLITAAKTAAVLALIVVVVTGVIQLATSTRDEGPEALRTLINDATMFHQKIEGSTLLEGFDNLLRQILSEDPEVSPGVRVVITDGTLKARGYAEQFDWLRPTTDTLELLNSLRKEGQLLQSCYSALHRAWSQKESGLQSDCVRYCEEAKDFFDQVLSLRAQNRTTLAEWQSRIERNTVR